MLAALPERPRLLVVDDQPINIQTLYQIFHAITKYSWPQAASRRWLFAAHNLPPDLILLDCGHARYGWHRSLSPPQVQPSAGGYSGDFSSRPAPEPAPTRSLPWPQAGGFHCQAGQSSRGARARQNPSTTKASTYLLHSMVFNRRPRLALPIAAALTKSCRSSGTAAGAATSH